MSADIPELAEYRVAIFSRGQDPHLLSEVFEEVLGLHRTDAMIWARHLPGILKEWFSECQAQVLASAIRQIGIAVNVVRNSEIPDLKQAQLVHHARCEEAGLQLIELHGAPSQLIPWCDIQMVCIGEVPLDTARHYPSGTWGGINAGHHYETTPLVTPHTPTMELWLICRPPLPHFRIDQEHMNYEYLGSRLAESSTKNFRHFVGDLTGSAKEALLSESTYAYLQHRQPEHYRFKSPDELMQAATLDAVRARMTLTEAAE